MSKEKTPAQKEAKALARAEYKAEGLRRSKLRKQKRKERVRRGGWHGRRGWCRCGAQGERHMHACPFDSEMNGDDSPKCYCCGSCQHDCGMSV